MHLHGILPAKVDCRTEVKVTFGTGTCDGGAKEATPGFDRGGLSDETGAGGGFGDPAEQVLNPSMHEANALPELLKKINPCKET